MTRQLELLSAGDPLLAPSTDIDDVRAALAGADPAATRTRMDQLLDDRPAPLDRTERPGHFTGSALVVDADIRRVLLLFHTKLQIWVQPGGHADGDANLAAVALREAEEETGIVGLRVWPIAIDLDIHRVSPPDEDPHFHHDVRFLVMAPRGAEVSANHESQGHEWVEPDRLESMGADAGLVRLVARGLELAHQFV